MVIRLALLVAIGFACWLAISKCLAKKIVDIVHLVESESKRERTTTYPKWNEIDPTTYSYDDYLFDIPEKMVKSEREYQLRKQIFDENLAVIRNFNEGKQRGGHKLGLNHFMDLFPEELPQPGYAKSQTERWNANAIHDSIWTVSDADMTTGKYQLDYWTMIDQLTTEDSELPKHVDWRIDSATGQPLATPVKAQGHCGSCWAFATTAALESYIAMASLGKTLMSLSMQELVSCVPNNNKCGGTGGCGGSTAELALDFVRQRGLVDEWHFGYQSYSGTNPVRCSLHDDEGETKESSASKFFEDAVVTVEGFVKLPTNNYTALLHAVATIGPVIVNVAANPWRFYEGGVFTPRGHSTDETDINHVVVLMGYGTDEESGENYWLVRNSYGPLWGEDGYIRLKRVDPSTLPRPDADCGMDVRPADGIACTEDNTGHHITPPAVKVCGTSGILFDPVLPVGARLIQLQ